jgi:hypothetical protein
MLVGTEHENPVILGRNDWKGPKAMQWGSVNAFGYYDITIEDPGPYEVKMIFKDPLPAAGQAKIRAGSRQYWISNSDTTFHEISLDKVVFDPGDHSFEGWYEVRGSVYSPICIEIYKQAE